MIKNYIESYSDDPAPHLVIRKVYVPDTLVQTIGAKLLLATASWWKWSLFRTDVGFYCLAKLYRFFRWLRAGKGVSWKNS